MLNVKKQNSVFDNVKGYCQYKILMKNNLPVTMEGKLVKLNWNILVLGLRYSNANGIPLQINFANKFLCYWAESFVYKQKRQ